jgi:hypothetical protein
VFPAGQRAGIGRVFAHQLRHSAATGMLAAGAPLTEISQVLRHRRLLSTAIYAWTSSPSHRHLRRAQRTLGHRPHQPSARRHGSVLTAMIIVEVDSPEMTRPPTPAYSTCPSLRSDRSPRRRNATRSHSSRSRLTGVLSNGISRTRRPPLCLEQSVRSLSHGRNQPEQQTAAHPGMPWRLLTSGKR